MQYWYPLFLGYASYRRNRWPHCQRHVIHPMLNNYVTHFTLNRPLPVINPIRRESRLGWLLSYIIITSWFRSKHALFGAHKHESSPPSLFYFDKAQTLNRMVSLFQDALYSIPRISLALFFSLTIWYGTEQSDPNWITNCPPFSTNYQALNTLNCSMLRKQFIYRHSILERC